MKGEVLNEVFLWLLHFLLLLTCYSLVVHFNNPDRLFSFLVMAEGLCMVAAISVSGGSCVVSTLASLQHALTVMLRFPDKSTLNLGSTKQTEFVCLSMSQLQRQYLLHLFSESAIFHLEVLHC